MSRLREVAAGVGVVVEVAEAGFLNFCKEALAVELCAGRANRIGPRAGSICIRIDTTSAVVAGQARFVEIVAKEVNRRRDMLQRFKGTIRGPGALNFVVQPLALIWPDEVDPQHPGECFNGERLGLGRG